MRTQTFTLTQKSPMTFHSYSADDSDAESDYSMASLPPFLPSTGSSHTSVDASMRSASPVPSVWSMSSSMREQAYRHEFGRAVNNYSEVYHLAADEEERDRLDKQHAIFIAASGGKYAPPMDEVMADNIPGETKAVLDLGCGTGIWIMDVARDYPQCSAVAVDLVPMQSTSMPPNLRSEVDDINLGLEHYYGDFNVVHVRLISSGIKDYPVLIDHISQVLRPGGLFDVFEFDFHAYDVNRKRVEVSTSSMGPPWWSRWLAFAEMAMRQRGGSPDAATHLHTWVSQHPTFEDIVYREFWLPVSPWAEGNDPVSRRINELGSSVAEDISAFLKSGRPLLLGSGLPENLVNELERNATEELRTARVKQFIRCQTVYARKKHIPQP